MSLGGSEPGEDQAMLGKGWSQKVPGVHRRQNGSLLPKPVTCTCWLVLTRHCWLKLGPTAIVPAAAWKLCCNHATLALLLYCQTRASPQGSSALATPASLSPLSSRKILRIAELARHAGNSQGRERLQTWCSLAPCMHLPPPSCYCMRPQQTILSDLGVPLQAALGGRAVSPPPKVARPTGAASLAPRAPSPPRGHTPTPSSSVLSHQDTQVGLKAPLSCGTPATRHACCRLSPSDSCLQWSSACFLKCSIVWTTGPASHRSLRVHLASMPGVLVVPGC